MTKKPETLPDHLRCSRNDGRNWRCARKVMIGKRLCEIHYNKMLINRRNSEMKRRSQSLVSTKPSNSISPKKNSSKKQSNAVTTKKDTSKEKVNTKQSLVLTEKLLEEMKGDVYFELMREFFQKQIERRQKSVREEELFKDLPSGLMAISTVPVVRGLRNNAGFFCQRKLDFGFDAVLRHSFRSKNVEWPLNTGPLKTVPFGANVVDSERRRKMSCHRCGRSHGTGTVQCSSCQRESFCQECIEKWYSEMAGEMKTSCPVCRGTCNCKTCLSNKPKDGKCKDAMRGRKAVNRILHFHYLVCLLLPLLKEVNREQRIELEIEGRIKGKVPSEIHIQRVECDYDEQLCCDNCKTSIVDFHRSCSSCSYDLCLSCCRELRQGILPGGRGTVVFGYANRGKAYMHGSKPLLDMRKTQISPFQERCVHTSQVSSMPTPDWKANSNDGSISCPPKEFGGCGKNTMDLKCVFPLNWTEELEISAEEIACSYEFPETLDASDCYFCTGNLGRDGAFNWKLQEAARREDSSDNFLYSPTREGIQDDLEHFQKHLSKGQPVIVRDVLQNKSDLNWDPLIMLNTFLERSSLKSETNTEAAKAIDCLDWCEVEIGVKQFFNGYLEGRTHSNMWPEMLKLKDWPSSKLFQEHCPAYNAEFLCTLPFQEYTNPYSGVFNVASKMPDVSKSDLGPHVYISYGLAVDLGRGDSVTKLYCESSDVVNVLAHTAEVPIFPEQLVKIIQLKTNHKTQDERESFRTSVYQKIGKGGEKDNYFVADSMEVNTQYTVDITGGNTNLPNGNSLSCTVMEVPEDCTIVVKDVKLMDSKEYDSCSKAFGFSTSCLNENSEHLGGFGEKSVPNSSGAQWDIFRREDVPKLQQYLRKYSNEFRHTYCVPIEHVYNPIFDQCFFLDTTHKKKLKEEFEIEPWTFDQHLGEAVIVPAGCPYQIRNLKSCVNVALDFVSPENVNKCMQLTEEVRLLPVNHVAKLDRLEVKKMSIYGISAAVKEINELISMTRNGLGSHCH